MLARFTGLIGLLVLLGIAYALSTKRKAIKLRIIAWGIALQVIFGLIILRTPPGRKTFDYAKIAVTKILSFTDEGTKFVVGLWPAGAKAYAPTQVGEEPMFSLGPETRGDLEAGTLSNGILRQFQDHGASFSGEARIVTEERSKRWRIEDVYDEIYFIVSEGDRLNVYRGEKHRALGPMIAFTALPTIVFFSSLMSILYHLGVMQRVVWCMAKVMTKLMGVSGAESLSVAANVFIGQTEAPLVVRPYVPTMTMSELMALMTGGFATIAGGVLAVYSRWVDAGHLLTASVMSAPAALVMAKILLPETEEPETAGVVKLKVEKTTVNVIDAAASGAAVGMKLTINVAAMLIAFVALIYMVDYCLGFVGTNLHDIFGFCLRPLAFVMGVPWEDAREVGNLLGTKIAINEFIAYMQLKDVIAAHSMSPKSITIATYALCGFANFGSVAIQLGGIGGIAPDRRADLAKLGLRALLGGALASFMTATIAGMLV